MSESKGALVLATLGGAGYFPVASGTLATALTLPIIYGVSRWIPVAPGQWYWPCLAGAILLFYPGVWAAGEAEAITGEHDSHKIVIDEVEGTLLAMAFLPASAF